MKYVIENETITLKQFLELLAKEKAREITRIIRKKEATIIETR